MRLLLDTHLLIWSLVVPKRLSAGTAALIRDPANLKFFSAASIWEIAIKHSLKRPDFDVDPGIIAEAARVDFHELHVTSDVARRVAGLPRHHRDPFDRLLVAQAIAADARLLTRDATLAAYAPHVLTAS